MRTAELRYRRLFEAAQDGILILDAETGAVTDVNPFLINMLGFSREEFVKKSSGKWVRSRISKPAAITLSVGVTVVPENGPIRTEILKAVDTALYQAKRYGRDQVVLSSP